MVSGAKCYGGMESKWSRVEEWLCVGCAPGQEVRNFSHDHSSVLPKLQEKKLIGPFIIRMNLEHNSYHLKYSNIFYKCWCGKITFPLLE